uniref:Uncharacterized protein n=1 Tax=Timema shepardi TaxID=629360 RepID=A0A7R9G1N6_TIMSH|nr:unnamed protein product [Timema shepardi]
MDNLLLRKTTLSTFSRDSSPDLSVTGNLDKTILTISPRAHRCGSIHLRTFETRGEEINETISERRDGFCVDVTRRAVRCVVGTILGMSVQHKETDGRAHGGERLLESVARRPLTDWPNTID